MAPGAGEEAFELDELSENDLDHASAETNKGVRIWVDVNDPDWREKVKEAYIAVLNAYDIPHGNGRKTALLKGDPSILKGIDFVDKRPK
jgi:hypothetical protein